MTDYGGNRVGLADFIRREKGAILSRWEEQARSNTEVARRQSVSSLADNLPELLDAIAETADHGGARPQWNAALISERHATTRLEQGYCLGELVEELVALRACIVDCLERCNEYIEPRESRLLHRAIDEALRESARRFMETQTRMLHALDSLALQPTTMTSLDDILRRLLTVLKDAAGTTVDCAVLFLTGDDGQLRVRASLGLDDDDVRDLVFEEGEGFTGTVFGTGQPMLLRDASRDPTVKNPAIRRHGTRALYAVPLFDGVHVFGVAQVGSRSAYAFTDDDILLFRTLTERASAMIIRAQFVDALERAAHFRETFIGVLGHDLRSPLQAISGTAQLLLSRETHDPEPLRAAHERMLRAATRMDRLITDILEFTRARLGGGFVLSPVPCSLRDIAEEVADEVRASSNREIRVEIDGDLTGEWDRERISQVLANVVRNADRHGRPETPVVITLRRDDSHARVEIANTGDPIAPQVAAKLFEPFHRTAATGGLGLGLFVARAIVEAHGGTISAKSAEQKTTFAFRLPLAPSQRPEAHTRSSSTDTSS